MFTDNMEMNKKSKHVLYLCAFMIPAVMMIFVMIVLGVYPFGARSILVSDLEIQFVDYYSYFKSIITGNNDFIYTFSKNLGGDMVGFSAYYLQNPLLFLMLLFPQKLLPAGIMVMMIVQIALSGLSFSYFINHLYKPRFGSLFFSTAYAFLGFFFAYISLPIYFTNLALLPIVLLGVTRIVLNHRDWKLYVFSLAIYVFMNYYLGFMMCIFSLLYFIYLICTRSEGIRNVRRFTKNIISYIVSSIAAIALISFDLAMIAFSLRGQKDGLSKANLSFYRQFSLLDFFSKLYSGSDKNHELPIVYCSVLVVVFVIFYFLCKKYTKREKLYSAGFLAILLLCFNIHTLNVVWHGFNDPVGFAYRYAYFFSFLLLFLGYRGFIGLEGKIERKQIVSVLVLFGGYSAFLLIRRNGYVGGRDILFNGMLICAVLLLTILSYKVESKKKMYLIVSLLGLVQIADLTSNAVRAIHFYPVSEMSKYSDEVTDVSELINEIKGKDNSLYRLEKDFQKDVNDSMQYDYAGLSHSSSCEKDYVKAFIGKMGFRNNNLWAYYHNGSTTFADSFLGVKYFLSRFDSTEKPYTQLFSKNGYFAYENPYALPFAFSTTEQMKEISMDSDNLFEIQNEIAGAFGGNDSIYHSAEIVEISTENLTESKADGVTTYSKADSEKESYIEYNVKVDSKDLLYLYFNAPHTQSAEILVNGDSYENYFTDTDWSILNIGRFAEGETVSVKLRLNSESLDITNALFYQESEQAVLNWAENSQAGQAKLEKITSSHLKGTVEIPEGKELLMFSIPYEEDWKIKIDGERVTQTEVLDALMAVELSSGKHMIEMQYVPKGFFPTIVISIITAVILMFTMINDKIKITECNKLERNYL